MSKPPASVPIEVGELVSNVRYGYWFNHYCERFYGHVDLALNLIQLVGGSTAAIGIIQTSTGWTKAAGVLLAAAAGMSLLIQPAVKSERHRRAKCEFLDLQASAWSIEPAELNVRLAQIQKEAPTGIESLAVPSYNATLDAIGVAHPRLPVSLLQRLAIGFA